MNRLKLVGAGLISVGVTLLILRMEPCGLKTPWYIFAALFVLALIIIKASDNNINTNGGDKDA